MNPIDAAEAELQQELREMFIVDTQQNLDAYFSPIQRLNPQSWTADIQQLYRSIHTIKGGAVTVSADAMLQVAIVLEDLLSDLRYLEIAPVLTDGELANILIEAGELLTSSIEITETGDRAIAQVQPTVQRLADLRDRVKQLYLPDWNEIKQVHQEFAEQGFDLVVLDLEMALTKLPSVGVVPIQTLDTATATISQLTQIGIDIELAGDWTLLLQDCHDTIAKPDCQLWTSSWFEYFEILKSCVKNSGTLSTTEIDRLAKMRASIAAIEIVDRPILASDEDLASSLDVFFFDEAEIDELSPLDTFVQTEQLDENLLDMLDDFFLTEEVELTTAMTLPVGEFSEFSGDLVDVFDRGLQPDLQLEEIETAPRSERNLDFETFAQSTFAPVETSTSLADPDLEILDRSIVDLVEISGNLEHSGSNFETSSQSIFAPADDLSENLVTLNTDFDTFAQSTYDLDDLQNDITDIFNVLDEFFEAPGAGAIASSTSSDSPEERLRQRADEIESIDDLPDLLDNFFDEPDPLSSLHQSEDFESIVGGASPLENRLALEAEIAEFDSFATLNEVNAVKLEQPNNLGSAELSASEWILQQQSIPEPTDVPAPSPEISPIIADASVTPNLAPVKRSVQIPVPLERLDKSAQQVVETLLSARAVTSISTQLQAQLSQLTTLTRENSQFVTRLRQLQDDYALMRNLSDEQQSGNNVTLERYRQGYSTIVRLLENILRLSELGQEIESSTYQSAIRMETLDRSIIQLKDGIEASRLVPFRNLTLRSKAILRDLTNRYGKPAELIVHNEHIELDAGIVQQLEPALLHLLRNAYDHGLESTQQRLEAGKPALGKIQISLHQRGNLYLLTIEDDGGGIDAELIHHLAQAKGFSLNRTNTNAELLAVLCQPGFSSSSAVSEVSGRGVGMDVVVSQLASIGGFLTLDTVPGRGTKFSIEVPAPQLLIPCVLFQVGDRTIAMPTDNVLETVLLSAMTTESLEPALGLCTWQLTNLRGEIPAFDLNKYWQPNQIARSLPDTAVCIRTRQAADTPEMWSIADDLLGQAKLLINPLPSPLIAPVGLLGVSLQPDGKLISILDPIALSATVSRTTTPGQNFDELATSAASLAIAKPSAPTILIVDDAAMIRRRLESSLNTYGFVTHTCNDGLEALTWLQTNPRPDLMITDVEMPNMDGFTLIDRARQANIDIPILVISSRSSEEWGKEARRLGATDYLNKGFATAEMIQKVNSLLGLLVEA